MDDVKPAAAPPPVPVDTDTLRAELLMRMAAAYNEQHATAPGKDVASPEEFGAEADAALAMLAPLLAAAADREGQAVARQAVLRADMRIRYHALAGVLGLPEDDNEVRGYYEAVDRVATLRDELRQARAEVDRLRGLSRSTPETPDTATLDDIVSEYSHACRHCPTDSPQWVVGVEEIPEIVRRALALPAPATDPEPATPPLCSTIPQGMECPGRPNIECTGCTAPAVSQAPAETPDSPDECKEPAAFFQSPAKIASRDDIPAPTAREYLCDQTEHTILPCSRCQPVAREDNATPDDDRRFQSLRGPCSCTPARAWIHVPGTYCGDTQYEQAVDAMRAATGRAGDERDEEAVAATLAFLADTHRPDRSHQARKQRQVPDGH